MVLEPFFDDEWDADVFFAVDEGLPFAMLGYEGFLNRWAVSFNGPYGYFVVEPADEFHDVRGDSIMKKLREKWPHLVPPEWL
jgi:hypothetical protein